MAFVPEKNKKTEIKSVEDLEQKFLGDKNFFSWSYRTTNIDFMSDFTDDTAQQFLTQIRAYATETEEDINLFINSRGGACTSLLAIIDGMGLVKNQFATIGIGQCASCGAVLLSAGAKGKRYITPNARVLIHQVRGGAIGTNNDVQIQAKEMDRINGILIDILAKNCGKTVDEIAQLTTAGDLILNAQQAIEFGIVDEILTLELIEKMNSTPAEASNSNATEFETELEPVDTVETEVKTSGEYSHTALCLEIKSIEEDDSFYYIKGLASTPDKDRVNDIVLPEALTNSVASLGLPKFIHQHQLKEMPLGICEKASQQIFNGKTVTLVDLKMPKDEYGTQIKVRAEMGAYGGLSIGYIATDWTYNEDKVRVIKELDWYEVSLVTVPANPNAVILQVKDNGSQEKPVYDKVEDVKDIRSAEKFLISCGVKKGDAIYFLKVVKSFVKGEPGKDEDQGEPDTQTDEKNVKALQTMLEGFKRN